MMRSIVLIVHGMSPKDFPADKKAEYMALRGKIHGRGVSASTDEKIRHDELERQMRSWPRTAKNDPFHAASSDIARKLSSLTGQKVFLGFNEFCAPSALEALESAVQEGAKDVTVITPMMTPGGHHSEEEIPEFISLMQSRHPKVKFTYAWPFPVDSIAVFLRDRIAGGGA